MIQEKRKYTHEHIAEKERTFMGLAVRKCVCIWHDAHMICIKLTSQFVGGKIITPSRDKS